MCTSWVLSVVVAHPWRDDVWRRAMLVHACFARVACAWCIDNCQKPLPFFVMSEISSFHPSVCSIGYSELFVIFSLLCLLSEAPLGAVPALSGPQRVAALAQQGRQVGLRKSCSQNKRMFGGSEIETSIARGNAMRNSTREPR